MSGRGTLIVILAGFTGLVSYALLKAFSPNEAVLKQVL